MLPCTPCPEMLSRSLLDELDYGMSLAVFPLEQWRTQDFSMGVSVTSHCDDVKILHYNYSSFEVFKCIVL